MPISKNSPKPIKKHTVIYIFIRLEKKIQVFWRWVNKFRRENNFEGKWEFGIILVHVLH